MMSPTIEGVSLHRIAVLTGKAPAVVLRILRERNVAPTAVLDERQWFPPRAVEVVRNEQCDRASGERPAG